MPKFDINKLTEKFDIQGIVSGVKSMINPGSVIPESIEGDPIATKLALIVGAMHNIAQLHEQQQQEMAKVNTIIASIYKDMEAAKKPSSETSHETKDEEK